VKESDVEVASKSAVRVYATRCEREDNVLYEMDRLRLQLMKVRVCGIESVSRAIIVQKAEGDKTAEEKRSGKPCQKLLIEGTALQAVMGIRGIKGTEAKSTHVMEVEKCLGIEAARSTIVHEIQDVMGNHGMDIDVRHVALLADVMTFRGEVLGITRFGMPKMSQSVLSLASHSNTSWVTVQMLLDPFSGQSIKSVPVEAAVAVVPPSPSSHENKGGDGGSGAALYSFSELSDTLVGQSLGLLIGWRRARGEVVINPPEKIKSFKFVAGDELIVLKNAHT